MLLLQMMMLLLLMQKVQCLYDLLTWWRVQCETRRIKMKDKRHTALVFLYNSGFQVCSAPGA